jgi:Domain of unknown function (DUF4394)
MLRHLGFLACGCALVFALASVSEAQTGYGVDGNGNLFSFDVTAPGSIPITPIGNVGFVPEGIDFRPGTNQLYAIDVGTPNTQLYTINIATAAATPVGAGFLTIDAGGAYNLSGNQHFGFDFNPSTLMADNSMRIRLVATNNDNLRVNSATGAIAVVDVDLLIPPSSAPFVDAAAYINNNIPNPATITTTLYDMDTRNMSLYTQNPPNNGTLNLVGPFGAGINDTIVGIGFDIYTDPFDVDPTIGGDSAYAVLKRTGTQNAAYLLYQVNLATGEITNGKLVGPNGSPSDFTGGFAMAPGVPEPTSLLLVFSSLIGICFVRRRP